MHINLAFEFKSKFNLEKMDSELKQLFPSAHFRGGESYHMGDHINGKLENGTEFVVYDTATSDYLSVPRNGQGDYKNKEELQEELGFELEVKGQNEEECKNIVGLILKAVQAYDTEEQNKIVKK